MNKQPRIAFIGAGSTVFMKSLVGDILQRPGLSGTHVALMDIDKERLDQSFSIAKRIVVTLGVTATLSAHTDRREALEDADFVITAFQVGGYEPCTVTDFEVPKEFGLRQTIADTLGVGGIMRGLRTVPVLWSICEDMLQLCPDATMLQYVNPMAISIWAIKQKFPQIKVVGLCHSVQHTVRDLAIDLGIDKERIRFDCAGINHIAFYTKLEEVLDDGTTRDLYPVLHKGYAEGRMPTSASMNNERCPNLVRYEMMTRLGYFVTESSEHFAEYVPWFIKHGRKDILHKYKIPLDEYPKRCAEQSDEWQSSYAEFESGAPLTLEPTDEYASAIIESMWTGVTSKIYGNLRNDGLITNLPDGCCVEVPCLVDTNGIQPLYVGNLPPQLTAIMQSSVSVQELVVEALMTEDPQYIYHAAMMDPHTAAELDLDQIWALVDSLLQAHNDWLPNWTQPVTSV